MKHALVNKVKSALDERGYMYAEYDGGCFDIAARGDKTMTIKVLSNIDSFLPFQASSLKRVSAHLQSEPLIIGMRTNKGTLDDGVMFERFGLPAFTVNTFEDVIDGEYPELRRLKGGLFGEIDGDALRSARLKCNLTQEELGTKLSVSKKTIYQHERGVGLANADLIRKAEIILEERITRSVTIRYDLDGMQGTPKNSMEVEVAQGLRKLGFSTFFVEKAPFDIMAEGREPVFSEVVSDSKDSRRNIDALREISALFERKFFLVSEDDVGDAPVITKDELSSFESSAELIKSLQKKRVI
ncbi:MAG: helix-turn-helix domain-containing protein [Candidatus Aenigmarchaeota archaeon]|nr:helix-turn-helix domain-containing protein [Candidatus Aenigmarchaeota archaeon]